MAVPFCRQLANRGQRWWRGHRGGPARSILAHVAAYQENDGALCAGRNPSRPAGSRHSKACAGLSSSLKQQLASALGSARPLLRRRIRRQGKEGRADELAAMDESNRFGCRVRVCLPAAPEEKELPIIGGEPDSGDPSVVAVYGVRPGSPGGLLCTGSVVAPTVVLTAAHCVAASETGLGVRFSVLTGANLSRGDGEQLAVREVHANPRWSPHNLEAGHDEGVVILSQPTRLRPLSLNRHPLANSTLGQLARIVGYGLADSSTQTGDGIKRQVLTRLQSMSTALIGVGTRRRGTCNGDSGGPAFMEMGGTETIVGTTSFGNSDCTDGGYDARVDTDLAFLDPYLASSCTPTCEQRWCGSDGCGGSCGTCSAGSSCSQAGQCAPSSSGCAAGGREQEPNDSALEANRLCAGGTI